MAGILTGGATRNIIQSSLITAAIFVLTAVISNALPQNITENPPPSPSTSNFLPRNHQDPPLYLINLTDPNSSVLKSKNQSTIYWESCPQTSAGSYFNVTFSPYPIQRNQMTEMTLHGQLNDDIPIGTVLQMSSSRLLGLIPGPGFKIDVCSFITDHFPNRTDIRCPIKQWAIPLIFKRIAEELSVNSTLVTDMADSTDGNNSENQGLKIKAKIPWFVLPGRYNAWFEMRTTDTILTCARTQLRVI